MNLLSVSEEKKNYKVRSLYLNPGDKTKTVSFADKDIVGPVDWGLKNHFDYRSYEYSEYSKNNVLCFGLGKLAGSKLPGTQRLIFSFRSPLWKGFFVSALGGAAHVFKRVGVDYVTIEGRSEKPSIIVLKGGKGGVVDVEFHEITENELLNIYKGYNGKEGVYALSEYLISNFSSRYNNDYRCMVVGPGSLYSNMGATFSATLKNNEMVVGSEEWAGRGGSGSVLYQGHGVAGIVFGGDMERIFPGVDLSDMDNVKDILDTYYNESYIKVIKKRTTKYRYNPKIESGGTFGSNIHCLGEFIPLMNWKMIYMPRDERINIHEKLLDKYWKPFNKESMEPRNWTTCGEPCPVVCKKHREGQHVDYEPYEADGPLTGSYEIHKTDVSVKKIDTIGFDAIEFGNLSAWILELISEGLLSAEELGLSANPRFDMKNFDYEKDSEINANLVAELADNVAYGKTEVCKVLRQGIRKAASKFDEIFKERIKNHNSGYNSYKDFAVYVPLGEDGCIAPTMYWAVGNFVPVPIQGKYLTYYQFGFFDPQTLAEECFKKAVYELYSENTGMCRFHRNWATEVIPLLLKKAWDIDIDKSHNEEIIRKMVEYDKKAGIKPSFWDSHRVLDIVAYGAKEFGNMKWWDEFENDKTNTARKYWELFLKSYEDKLGISWDYDYQSKRV